MTVRRLICWRVPGSQPLETEVLIEMFPTSTIADKYHSDPAKERTSHKRLYVIFQCWFPGGRPILSLMTFYILQISLDVETTDSNIEMSGTFSQNVINR